MNILRAQQADLKGDLRPVRAKQQDHAVIFRQRPTPVALGKAFQRKRHKLFIVIIIRP